MILTRADTLTFDPRGQLSRVFVEGFYEWVKPFHKDKEILVQIFTHVFCPEYFYVALDGETVCAMAACTQGYSPIVLKREEFIKVLGFLRGNLMYFSLKRHIVRNEYPFTLSKNTGTIEFVATEESHRNQGLAHKLLTHLIEQTPYDAYVLEVADLNKNALKLYTKLGFKEMKRIKAAKNSGTDYFIYMRKS
ncbi:MAG: GNAT family N-acetyltransferase [Defluviitaleaceae bacterium]|nr:GNAT family N-acetyltransferase [Defluviitaleaceae bacterium]